MAQPSGRGSTTVHLYELAWILPSIAIPVGMLAALTVTAFGAGIHLPTVEGRVPATQVAQTAPWLALAVGLIALAYGPSLARLVATTPFDTVGMRVW